MILQQTELSVVESVFRLGEGAPGQVAGAGGKGVDLDQRMQKNKDSIVESFLLMDVWVDGYHTGYGHPPQYGGQRFDSFVGSETALQVRLVRRQSCKSRLVRSACTRQRGQVRLGSRREHSHETPRAEAPSTNG